MNTETHKGIFSWIFSTDHKRIGLLSLYSILGFFLTGVVIGLLMRLELLAPGRTIVGAIPPAIGWSSAGGDLFDPGLLALCVFFFLWQVPHFWFLSLAHAADYKQAGLPTIGEIFGKKQISRITSVWILSMAVAGLTLQVYLISSHHTLNAGLYAVCLWLFAGGFTCIRHSSAPLPSQKAFNRINMYMPLSMLILSGESLLFL